MSSEIEIHTEALKAAIGDFTETLIPLYHGILDLLKQYTDISSVAWGAIGAATVNSNYRPARTHQVQQMTDLVKCLSGVNAGLYSVVLHYDEAELENAKAAYDAARCGDTRQAALRRLDRAEERAKADEEEFAMAKAKDDSYHHNT